MSSLLLSKSEQGLIIFHIWKSLSYKSRLGLSILLILAGFALQYFMFFFFPGIILVLAGNLLLLVKGYDNRMKLDAYNPAIEWIKTDEKHLLDVISINKKMKRWDLSAFDITSGCGVLVFLFLVVLLILSLAFIPSSSSNGLIIIAANFAVLIIPHWFTGVKRISTTPNLVNKIEIYLNIVKNFTKELENNSVNYLMLLDGKRKYPVDVKMKLNFKDQPEDFLGLYAQISMNEVQGTYYPYFYVVLVAKANSGLIGNSYQFIDTAANIVKELKNEGDAEILVIRQKTTKNSGYHTNNNKAAAIFMTGLESVKKITQIK